MKLNFDPAIFKTVAPPRRRPRIGWFVKDVVVETASLRYRCFHFARALDAEFDSVFFREKHHINNQMAELDAVIIVKRLDAAVIDLVAKAERVGTPVFLDLCDDVVSLRHSKNDAGLFPLRFFGIAPYLAGIVVPSANMANRIEEHASERGISGLPIHVIPDVAETWDDYRETKRFVDGTVMDPALPVAPKDPGKKSILWFGNYGGRHSNFGMFSLRPTLKHLAKIHREQPLELVVVSNNETVFEALIEHRGIPARYVPWSPETVYSELAAADMALMTGGDDEFCTIKSSNRVVQALAAGVPVVTQKAAPVAEFDDAIFSGTVEDGVRTCIIAGHDAEIAEHMAEARRVLKRFTPHSLSRLWKALLDKVVDQPEPIVKRTGKALVVFDQNAIYRVSHKLLDYLNGLPDLKYEVLCSVDLLRSIPKFAGVLRRSRAIPRFYEGDLHAMDNLLRDKSVVVMDRPDTKSGQQMRAMAKTMKVPLLTVDVAMTGALGRYLPLGQDVVEKRSVPTPGPYDEWTREDGSVEWAFVVHGKGRGWILDAICKEIGSRQPESWKMVYYPKDPPPSKNLFFAHYLLHQIYLDRYPQHLEGRQVFIWYTHPREEDPETIAQLLTSFENVHKVIFTCESNRQLWLERGLSEERTAVVLGAADPELFYHSERGGGVVGLSSSFYERKNPEALLEVVKALPHRKFLLLGRNWNQYSHFEELRALPNFEYRSASYREYGDIYANFDVFLSISNLEGGPIPLVEAMMANAVPVASNTGFAPDIIEHGKNGFIFEQDASVEDIAGMIEQAFALEGNIRETVEELTWDQFSADIVELAR